MDESAPKAVYCPADFEHWSKAVYWRIPEAVSLLFGEDPDTVQRKMIKRRLRIQPFASSYDRILDLANRAVKAKQIRAFVSPGVFLAWARRNGIDYPYELERQVLMNGHKILDWQVSYEIVRNKYYGQKRDIAVLTQSRDDLVRQVKSLEEQIKQAGSKRLATKERESVMKLIIGMAIRGYRYDPVAARNEAIGEICGDLAHLGLSLDPDTVRKWLREAAELLPRQDSGLNSIR